MVFGVTAGTGTVPTGYKPFYRVTSVPFLLVFLIGGP